jgi:ketol-acid reductoisomerase
VKKNLRKGQAVCFAHGFSVAFGLVKPPKFVDVVMVAPKATGARLRDAYLKGESVPAFASVHQDATGNAKKTAVETARALGLEAGGRKVFWCTFREEACANLFGEQAVTLGGAVKLVQAGFDEMVARGIPPELACCECVHVTKLVIDLLESKGLAGTVYGVSETASYGGLSRGSRVVDSRVRKRMAEIFSEIESGKFTRELLAERKGGSKNFAELRRREASHPLERAHRRLGKRS